MTRLFRRLKYILNRNRKEEELADELSFHRALAEDEQRDAGLPAEMARSAASQQMGNTTMAREAANSVWLPAAVEGVAQDLRYAWRGLLRNKGLLAVGCLSLGLSTGFGTSLFSVVNAVILQPVTVKRPEALIRVWVGDGNRISYPNLHDICDDTPGVVCSGYRMEELMWNEGDEPVRLFAQAVSPHYFQMMGIQVGQGRAFTKESVRETADTVVITRAFWERQLGGDANVLGRRLVLSGHSYTVIGVLPHGFRSVWGLGIAPSLYLPAGSSARPVTARRAETQYEILGMLSPGQSTGELQARILSRAKGLEATYPIENTEFGRVQMFPFHRLGLFLSAKDSMMNTLLVFGTVVIVFVLLLALVACINVAGLLVAKALAREREIMIRLSIGCSRFRLARLLLAESLLLSLAGVGLGAILSIWLAQSLVAIPLPFPVPLELEVPIDTHLLMYLAALVGVSTLVVSVAPVLQASRVSVVGGSGSGHVAHGFRRWSLRGVLIAGQIAVSTILLVSSTLFVRSLWQSTQIDPGFDIEHVATVETDTSSRQMKEAETAEYHRNVIARIKALPDVTAVSGAIVIPLSMNSIVNGTQVDRGGKDEYVKVNTNHILPDYFRTMGIPLRAGREFTEADRQVKPRTAIVNETFARRVFPGRSAIGGRVRRPVATKDTPDPWAEIVAVVADSRYLTLGEETLPQVYWPYGPNTAKMTIHVRGASGSDALVRSLPQILSTVDSRVTVRVRPLRAVMAIALFPAQAAALVLAALGIVGWGLTVAGLYGLVAYTVTRRIPEIGVRVALGANPAQVMRLLLRDGLAVALTGLAAGLVVAALVTPFLSMFLSGVPPRDLVSFAFVAFILTGTALVASFVPARRGVRLSPTVALRND